MLRTIILIYLGCMFLGQMFYYMITSPNNRPVLEPIKNPLKGAYTDLKKSYEQI